MRIVFVFGLFMIMMINHELSVYSTHLLFQSLCAAFYMDLRISVPLNLCGGAETRRTFAREPEDLCEWKSRVARARVQVKLIRICY